MGWRRWGEDDEVTTMVSREMVGMWELESRTRSLRASLARAGGSYFTVCAHLTRLRFVRRPRLQFGVEI